MAVNNQDLSGVKRKKDTFNIKEEIFKYLIHWKWFVVSLIIFLGLSYLKLRYEVPQYSASTTIMIKEDESSGISQELSALSDMGFVGKNSNNTDSEVIIIKSRKIISKVVESLQLNLSYFIDGRVKKTELYKNSPIELVFNDKNFLKENKNNSSFIIELKGEEKFDIKNTEDVLISSHKFKEDVDLGFGAFKVIKTKDFVNNKNNRIFVVLSNKLNTVESYRRALMVDVSSQSSNVVNLSITNSLPHKAEAFLDELVKQYNQDAINDKSKVSEITKNFIDERLAIIGKDLSKIQDSVKNFRTKNKISGLSSEGEIALENASSNNEQIIELRSELALSEGILKNITNNSDQTLPPNLGLKDLGISESIIKYNSLVNRKNNLGLSAGVMNPALIKFKNEVAISKSNLEKSVKYHILSLRAQLEELNKYASVVNKKVSAIPGLEREFIDIARQQEIIANLYSYLLKKKEETAITLAVTASNAKIIDYAYSGGAVSPDVNGSYIKAIFIALLIPVIIIYLKNLLDTKIHTRKDIEDATTIPFLGDIPHDDSKKKIIIGESDVRSSTAEAFRLIRTNLDFMLPSMSKSGTGEGKTIFITSTTSGEGKSFISINLASVLSLSNKKVLLLGMDLRAPKITSYLGIEERKGITNFITDNKLSLKDLKFNIPEIKGLDIIASGVIPPNPAELLLTDRVEELFKEVRKEYDYIIVDTAPVNLVTDTLLISKYSDIFLYVTRANYLDKRMLVVPETLYTEKKLPNMAVLLNDTDITKGYGYGYGYGYVDNQKKSWFKKVFS
ncbi:GumC family protein [Polaribacter sargassicola]|uniref:GumC family protein n=1 Tax=Polaribacter sargassicola TaxID=2836891 RepID=UPI001F029797|nr:polysaccharide biosynthesis tyrosine autokinase [Polaribacter sp. DS7-9]MCG1036546.1 polysaccharide biosynthesis tyrosine autokinase [Polaribacter sp. DS7-9]